MLEKNDNSVFRHGQIRKSAEKLHNIIYEGIGLAEEEKPLFISSCLIALKDEDFRREFSGKATTKGLISACKGAIENEIKEISEGEEQQEKYENLKTALLKVIQDNKKLAAIQRNEENSFANILKIINEEVYPYLQQGDIIGEFYHEFLKYSTGDGGALGIVLTPSHIAELFCDLSLRLLGQEKFKPEDKVLDICCGTGSFLVSALSRGVNKNNLYGIEIKAVPYNLALTNMILRGDDKSHIYHRNCFDPKLEKKIREAKCNFGFLNPPYSQKDTSEIKFIHYLCDLLESTKLVVVIVPLSVAIGTKYKAEREKLLKKHTLKAVMTMPSNLFSANRSGSHTCIMVWETGKEHHGQTWLSNWKDDGFTLLKGKRIDKKNEWPKIKEKWLEMFCKKEIPFVATFQTLSSEDCWLADAYLETDYSQLTEKDFEKTIRDYLAFRISVLEEEKNE